VVERTCAATTEEAILVFLAALRPSVVAAATRVLPATGIPIAAITAASFVAALWLHEHPKLHRCADSPPNGYHRTMIFRGSQHKSVHLRRTEHRSSNLRPFVAATLWAPALAVASIVGAATTSRVLSGPPTTAVIPDTYVAA
jgi:hypothetical protein